MNRMIGASAGNVDHKRFSLSFYQSINGSFASDGLLFGLDAELGSLQDREDNQMDKIKRKTI